MNGVAVVARFVVQLEQSLSVAAVQPGGQQPSPPVHAVMGVPTHTPDLHELLVMQALVPVHIVPSGAAVPPMHVPIEQASPVMQGLLFEHAMPSGALLIWHASSDSTHTSIAHGEPVAGHGLGIPVHMPFWHDSITVQNIPVLQIVPLVLGVFTQPIPATHVPVLQMSVRNVQFVIVVPKHVPLAHSPAEWHMSVGVHGVPSLPGMVLQLLLGSSHMPTLHVFTPGHIFVVPMHVPIMHVSFSVQ
jgi:hypothetical protein